MPALSVDRLDARMLRCPRMRQVVLYPARAFSLMLPAAAHEHERMIPASLPYSDVNSAAISNGSEC
jgi:hypothetical protein